VALPACDIYDLGAVRGDQVSYATGVVMHDGGNIADSCVLDVLLTGASVVGLAAAPPVGAVAVIASWSVFGASGGQMMSACFGSWNETVEPNLMLRGIAERCFAAVGPDGYTNCVYLGWALWIVDNALWQAGQQLAPFAFEAGHVLRAF